MVESCICFCHIVFLLRLNCTNNEAKYVLFRRCSVKKLLDKLSCP
uniref:Uncharacterized protein n=1 Tax=Arundo donax TaxID=35708 RepID=A0A0A9F9I0_ARUDO